MTSEKSREPVLRGLRVLDIAHQYSAANTCGILADLGAEVVSVEHPAGSPIRTMLPKKEGISMWWKVVQRGKKHITLNLSKPQGREIFLRMIKDFDVLVENFRPGTLEKWGLGPEDLERAGANLAMVRISGYGQTGPYRSRPGFGTAAEAMSGFAHLNGFPDGPPIFPSTTLADGVASLWGVIGALSSSLASTRLGGTRGVEVIDVALFESLFRIVPTQLSTYQQFGEIQNRPGNYLGSHGVLRNTYGSRDGRYFIVAAVGPVAIRRILVGAKADHLLPVLDQGVMHNPNTETVYEFLSQCDQHLTRWAVQHDYEQLISDLDAAGAVFSPVYTAEDIYNDPQYRARDDVVTVNDPDLGTFTMQGIVPKFPQREHAIRHAGGRQGQDNQVFYGEMGYSSVQIGAMQREGVI
ncbi:CoA transferase [Comamonas sp. Y33R10-2]|uniref:CaiB/BaiF CoA transferase family protein n=1 Tax=Comamonas sp. Y33R10-2 TaxID=2853257 RepID=UPI001C5CB5B6|nr:CaiB/BaiF CoA-transferase family protein [Comamonas sp. Y33R10-2]QXZ10706.1 CoA transferase [Comamonas sp. Y33R10-2]